MDIEQLKLILETVRGATGDVKDVAIYWLALEAGKVVVGYVASGIGIYALVKVIKMIIAAVATNTMSTLRDIVLPDQAGTYVTASEIARVREAIVYGMGAKRKAREAKA